jgi:hypothetical protein
VGADVSRATSPGDSMGEVGVAAQAAPYMAWAAGLSFSPHPPSMGLLESSLHLAGDFPEHMIKRVRWLGCHL